MFKVGRFTFTNGKIASKVYNYKNELTGYIVELTVRTAISLDTNWIRYLLGCLTDLIFENEYIEDDTEEKSSPTVL